MLNTNYDMNEFNQMIIDKICIAHHQGNTPSIILTLPNLETETLGHFLYLLELTATIGAYLLDMNPFDQPGVEIYKQEIKTLCTKHFCG
ncbi:MAG: hypothetical protein PUB18_05520 [bacterium]|nr:hypothetical protein [bacterium]